MSQLGENGQREEQVRSQMSSQLEAERAQVDALKETNQQLMVRIINCYIHRNHVYETVTFECRFPLYCTVVLDSTCGF